MCLYMYVYIYMYMYYVNIENILDCIAKNVVHCT